MGLVDNAELQAVMPEPRMGLVVGLQAIVGEGLSHPANLFCLVSSI
jgi:hypothetical protein